MGRRTSRRSSAATSSACSRPTSRRGADGLPPSSDTWSPGRVDGITAAATGTIAGAAVVLGRRAIVDVPTALLALGTLAALVYARRIPEPVLIVAAGVVRLVIA